MKGGEGSSGRAYFLEEVTLVLISALTGLGGGGDVVDKSPEEQRASLRNGNEGSDARGKSQDILG